jgi:hypothetical protein
MSRRRAITGSEDLIGRLLTNSMVGLVLLFLTNLFLSDDIPINLVTLFICAIDVVGGLDPHPDPPPSRGSILGSRADEYT